VTKLRLQARLFIMHFCLGLAFDAAPKPSKEAEIIARAIWELPFRIEGISKKQEPIAKLLLSLKPRLTEQEMDTLEKLSNL
jgi:hypothetical protein